jgi:hypothetical protein
MKFLGMFWSKLGNKKSFRYLRVFLCSSGTLFPRNELNIYRSEKSLERAPYRMQKSAEHILHQVLLYSEQLEKR